MYKKGRWTKEEETYLEENYFKKVDREIAAELGRTTDSVKYKRLREGLDKYFSWGTDDDDKLEELYNEGLSDAEIAEELGNRTEHSIAQRRSLLGLIGQREKKRAYYTVYKNDFPIAHGTIEEIAHSQGVCVPTVYGWIRGRTKSIEVQEVL